MKNNKIALLCGEKTTKTRTVADEVVKQLGGEDRVDFIPVETAKGGQLAPYDKLILGSATWYDGELPFFWDEFLPDLERTDLKGKEVAIFGLGNNIYHSDNFCDAIGILAEVVEHAGGTMIGETDGFKGLPIDYDNEPDTVEDKIKEWIKQLGW